jgi:hypothetical protein
MGANLGTWLRVIWRFRGQISWRFIPKVLVLTLMILLFTPLIWWERLRFDRRIRRVKVKAPIFILGHQRSGTTYLHYLLGRDPQFGFLSVKEGFMPWIYLSFNGLVEWMLRGKMPEKRPMDDLRLGVDMPTEPEYSIGNMTWASMLPGYMFPTQLSEVFRKNEQFDDLHAKKAWQDALLYFMQKLSWKHNGRQLITKAPENLSRIDAILEVFPDAKFIHIYRDPYRVYFSTERLYGITLPLVAMQHVSEQFVHDFIVDAYRERFTRYFETRHHIPKGNLVEIRYEDLIGNELNVLEAAYAILGIPFEAAREHIRSEVKSYEGYRTNTYNYDPERMREIREAWAPIFEKLGYSDQPSSASVSDA